MTKEEKIKEAWGLNYDEFSEHIDSDGWAIYPNFQKHEMVQNVRPIEFRSQGTDFRPKSLQGIENNNGWIKIESEADLPKDDFNNVWIIHNDGDVMIMQCSNKYLLKNCTHYQPIVKPKTPIY